MKGTIEIILKSGQARLQSVMRVTTVDKSGVARNVPMCYVTEGNKILFWIR